MTDQRIREIMPLALVRMIQKGELTLDRVCTVCYDMPNRIQLVKDFLSKDYNNG